MNLHGRTQQTLNNISLSLPTADTDSSEEESPMADDIDNENEESPMTKDPDNPNEESPMAQGINDTVPAMKIQIKSH